MNGYKRGKYLEFVLDNGKSVKYDLSTGQSIGVRGNPVRTVAPHMRNTSISDIINSIDDKNYRNFLRYVYGQCSNTIKNFGTLLLESKRFLNYEQYFSSGIEKIIGRPPLFNDCPKKLLSLCREHNLTLDKNIIDAYKDSPDFFNLAYTLDYISLNDKDIYKILQIRNVRYDYHKNKYTHESFYHLVEEYGYTFKSFLEYIDRLVTYEALDVNQIYGNLRDYLRMSSEISNRFDKYPKNLLTTHQITVRNYERIKQEINEQKFKETVNPALGFKTGDYVILYPESSQDIKDEAVQQHNCVASYIDRVINRQCNIVFLRKKDNPEKSYITVELIDGKVVQAYRAYNQEISSEDKDILNKYEEYLKEEVYFENNERIA